MNNKDRLREYGAVTLLQRTLEKYAKRKHITLEKALKIFVDTPLYEGLFDYEGTALWKEGPDYLLNMLDGFIDNILDTLGEKNSAAISLDPFYSEENMSRLRRSVEQMERTGGTNDSRGRND